MGLNRLQTENDQAIITLEGQQVAIEQAFAAQTNFATGASPFSVAVGDFNGDGKLDLAVANYLASSATVSILLGNGTGGFSARTTISTGANPSAIDVGDWNGDSNLDLAVTNYGSNRLSFFQGNGA